jgi:dipeptidyl aminopeptidase/acylaminoacyl peptidase
MRTLRIVFCLALFVSGAGVEAARLTVDDFLANPDVYDVAISPSGRYLAEIFQQKDMRIVAIRDLDAPGSPAIGQLGDRIVRPYSVMWVSDERLLIHLLVPYNTKAVRKQSEKKEDFDIDDYYMARRTIAINRDAKGSVQLMSDARRARGNWNLSRVRRIRSDSKHVLMPAFVEDRLTLFKVNVYDGTSQVIVSGKTATFAFVCDAGGRPLYRLDITDFGKAMKIFRLEGEEWEYVEKIGFDEGSESNRNLGDLVGLTKDGGLLYRKRNEKTGYYEILKHRVKVEKTDMQSEVVVSLPDRDVLGLIIDEENDEVIGYRIEEDVFRDRYFDKARQAEYDNMKNKLSGYGFHFHSVDHEGRRNIVRSYGPDFPGSFFLYDRKKDELTLYANEYGRLKLEDMAEPAVATYLTRDQARIRTYILFPPGYKPGQSYPMVLLVHGGPHARSYALYDDFAQFIATRGYIVIEPNFRGSTGYGLEFEKAGYKQWGRLMQDDLDDAVAFMVKKGFADPSRVCIAGASYGGYAALMGLIKNPSTYKCAISINGVTDLRDQVKFDLRRFSASDELVKRVRETIGDPDIDREYLDGHSPLLRFKEIKSPLLLIAGERDQVVPFYQSRDLANALRRSKGNITFLPIEKAGHNVFYRDYMEQVYKAVEEFLLKNL